MSAGEAFKKLWDSEPETELDKKIRSFFLANLPDDITTNKEDAPPQDSFLSKIFVKEKSDLVRSGNVASENRGALGETDEKKIISNTNLEEESG